MIRRPPRSTLFPYTRSSDLERIECDVKRCQCGDGFAGGVVDAHTGGCEGFGFPVGSGDEEIFGIVRDRDRKSTRLNSSHPSISYAVFCLKKKKKIIA